jgi:hypothetical protein
MLTTKTPSVLMSSEISGYKTKPSRHFRESLWMKIGSLIAAWDEKTQYISRVGDSPG